MPSNGPAEKVLYGLNGIPIFTYGMIGITTLVLAYVTFMDVDINEDADADAAIESPLNTINPMYQLAPPTAQETVQNVYSNKPTSGFIFGPTAAVNREPEQESRAEQEQESRAEQDQDQDQESRADQDQESRSESRSEPDQESRSEPTVNAESGSIFGQQKQQRQNEGLAMSKGGKKTIRRKQKNRRTIRK